MSRRTTRLGYLGTVLVLAVLLVLFGQPYLFCMLQLLLALGITQAVCIRRDARRLHFTVCGPGSCRAGEDMLLTLRPCYTGRLLAAKYALVQMEVCNDMLSASRRYELWGPLYEGAAAELRGPAAACGGGSVRCTGMQVWDMLSLSCAQAPLPETIYTMVWPRTAKVRLEPQLDTVGAAHLEQRFTRLIIVSAGPYEQNLQLVQQYTGISVVCAAQQEQPVYTTLSPTCEMAVLPADLQSPEGFRVIC